MLLTQVTVVLVLVAVAVALATYDARSDARASAADRSLAVARAVADAPDVAAALASDDPSRVLQPYAELVRHQTDVDFVVVMALDRTRFTHPTKARIGEKFVGDLGPAPRGGTLTQQYAGTLGPSVRSVVPVVSDGRVVALVAVGITISTIDAALRRDLVLIGLAALVVLAVGVAGSWLVNRRVRRQTHGMGEREIARMYEYYRAVLHAVREGLVLLDDAGTVQLVNDEARRLLDLGDDVVGADVRRLGLPPGLVGAALGTTPGSDDLYLVGDHLLVVSSSPASWEGRAVGVVVTLRDHTELQAVTGELDVARGLTSALRSQNHEAANRLHTVVSLIEMGHPEEAVDFATEELQVAQLLTDQMVANVGDPVVAALLLGKSAEAAERGVTLGISGTLADGSLPSRDLVTVLGNLLDNALDAVADCDPRRIEVRFEEADDGVAVVVADSGPGLADDDAEHAFERGWSTKAGPGSLPVAGGRGVGLALVRQVARRHGGDVHLARSADGGAELSVVLPRVAAR